MFLSSRTIDRHKNIYLKYKYILKLNIINSQAHKSTIVKLVSWQINIFNLHIYFCFSNIFMCLMYAKYRIIFAILMVMVPLIHGLDITKCLKYFYIYLRQYIFTVIRFWFQLF